MLLAEKFSCLLLFVHIFCVCHGQNYVNDKCSSPDGHPGLCLLMNECKAAVDAFLDKGYHDLERCGFEGMIEIVCCLRTFNVADRFDEHPTVAQTITTPPPQLQVNSVTIAPPSITSLRRADIECKRLIDSLLPPLEDHIIGGTDAREGEFAHMAALGYIKENQTKISFVCGGTLISATYVVTAGHCIKLNKIYSDLKPTKVRIGVIDITSSPNFDEKTDYEIVDAIAHPDYAPPLHYNDIGLVRLAKAVSFTMLAHPVCLYTKKEIPKQLIVTGWGVIDAKTRERKKILQKLVIPVVPNEICNEHYKKFRTIRRGIVDEQLCAGGVPDQDSCQGDSGGPLQTITENDGHYRLVGITSFGTSCGTNISGVYTKVSSYLDWIESVVWPIE